jgi:hypothetical protein
VYTIYEVATINDVATSVPRIYATIENKQEDHLAFAVELEGIIIE